MDLNNIFSFTSPAQRREKERAYEKKLFPLGIEQRDFALKALRPLINSKKSDAELLFAFISTKEKLIDDSEQMAYAYLERQRYFSDLEKAYIMALVLLDVNVVSLEEYPNTEDVKSKKEST